MGTFKKELEELIQCRPDLNTQDTPPSVLAEYLTTCLLAFDKAVEQRNLWHQKQFNG